MPTYSYLYIELCIYVFSNTYICKYLHLYECLYVHEQYFQCKLKFMVAIKPDQKRKKEKMLESGKGKEMATGHLHDE